MTWGKGLSKYRFDLRKFSDPWEQNLNLNQTPKIHTSTPHYTERAPTVFREPMVRSDQVIPGNLIFRDDSRAVCTGGHHIHIRYRFAPAAAARVQLRRCVRLTWDTRARAVRCHTCLLALHALLFHFRNGKWAVEITPRPQTWCDTDLRKLSKGSSKTHSISKQTKSLKSSFSYNVIFLFWPHSFHSQKNKMTYEKSIL